MLTKNSIKIILKSLYLPLSVSLLGLVVLNTPLPRQIGLAFRYDLLIPLVILLILNEIFFNLPGRIGQVLAPIYTMLIFALPLSGLWASGTSEQYVFGGTFPTSDGINYYIDALHFLEGGFVSQFSADKPFISSLLSGLLAITHYNWINTLIIILLLVIGAVYLATRELQRTHGTLSASIFLIILFLFFRRYSGTAMAESLGICFGLLAFVCLWRYAFPVSKESPGQPVWLISGIGILTLALLSRLGAFLIIPFLFIGIIWNTHHKKHWQSWKIPAITLIVIFFVFAINRLVIFLIGGPDIITSAQFSTQLYSLVTGGKYFGSLASQHPELFQLTGNEFLIKSLQICFSVFLQNPLELLVGVFHNYGTYFADPMRGEYSYIDGSNDMVNQGFRLVCLFLALVGLGTFFHHRNRTGRWLVWLCFGGLILSIPFVPPEFTFKLRLMAATIWIQALLPALAIAWMASFLPKQLIGWQKNITSIPQISAWSSLIFAILLGFALVVSPIVIRLTAHPTPLPTLSCPAGQKSIVMRAEPGTYVELVDQDDPREGWRPYIRIPYFKIKIHNIAEMSQFPIFEAINKPTVLLEGLDLLSNAEVLIFAPAAAYSEKPGIIQACGNYMADPPPYTEDFFFANNIKELGIP